MTLDSGCSFGGYGFTGFHSGYISPSIFLKGAAHSSWSSSHEKDDGNMRPLLLRLLPAKRTTLQAPDLLTEATESLHLLPHSSLARMALNMTNQ